MSVSCGSSPPVTCELNGESCSLISIYSVESLSHATHEKPAATFYKWRLSVRIGMPPAKKPEATERDEGESSSWLSKEKKSDNEN